MATLLNSAPRKWFDMYRFDATVSALSESLLLARGEWATKDLVPGVHLFVAQELSLMPDYLRAGVWVLTLAFGLSACIGSGRSFHRLSHDRRLGEIERWRRSPLNTCRAFVRLFESLVIIQAYSMKREDGNGRKN